MKHTLFTKILSLLLLLGICFTGNLFPYFRTRINFAVRADSEISSSTDYPQAGDYACILTPDVFFYATPDENQGLFLLPATYYVRLLDYGNEYCRVEYFHDDAQTKKLTGYVKTSLLTFVDYVPKRPYFFYTFTLSYRIDETLLEDSAFLNEITISCTYYGDYKIGSKTYCYVLRGDSFGYVPKPISLFVQENTEYAEYVAAQQAATNSSSSVEEEPKKEGASPAQIAILVALCLLVPVLAALILKPPHRPPYEIDAD